MGVQAVDFGHGKGPEPITADNAKEALQRREELGLNTSQIKFAESFLTAEEKDEIMYSETESTKRGEGAIGDKEKADSHDKQIGNATATSVGMAAGAAAACVMTKKAMAASGTDGNVGFWWSMAVLGTSLLSVVMAKLFDNAYTDRTGARDNGDSTNETLDGYTDSLEESMDSMNEDGEEYKEAIKNYTLSKNDNTNRKAELQIELMDAMAMGDKKKAAELQQELEGLGETDFSKEEEDMQEVKDRLEEYSSIADEAKGASGAAESVAEFLKQGLTLGVFATVDALLLAVTAGYAGAAIATATFGATASASHLDFAGMCKGYVAAAIYGVAVGMFGTAATTMGNKAKNEFECFAKGGEMQDHVNTLNGMIGEQTAYVDQTTEGYEEQDQGSEDSQDDAAEKAGKATSQHGKSVNNKKKKDEAGAATGGGGSGGGGSGNA